MSGRKTERGAALLMTLMLVAALSAVAVSASERLSVAARRASNAEDRDQALWNLMGAEALARQIIRRDHEADGTRTTRDGLWARAGVSFLTDGGRIGGSILDRSNCFNLNSLGVLDGRRGYTANPETQAELQSLAEALDVDGGDAERLAAAAADWIDGDTSPRGRGAEDFDYQMLDPPYRAANAPFTEVEEVRALAGVSERTFRVMRPYLCAHPTAEPSRLNVNTLRDEDAPLLVAVLGGKLDLDAARDLIAERPAGGWIDAPSFWSSERFKDIAVEDAVRERIAVATRYFELDARVEHRGAVAEGATLFERTGAVVTVVSRRIGGDA
jgi:general secretion pathway protein K